MADPAIAASPQASVPQPQDEARMILQQHGAIVAEGEGNADPQPPAAEPAAAPQVTDGKVTVDWGGTPREVDIQDLVKQAMATENAQTVQAAAQAEIEKLGYLKALANEQTEWSDSQKERFAEIVKDPKLLDTLGQTPPMATPDDDLEFDVRPPLGGDTQQPGKGSVGEQLQPLTEAVRMLLQREHGRDQTTAKESLDTQVTDALGSFSVFKKDPGALATVKQNVIDRMILNPDANLLQVAGAAAQDIQNIIHRASGAAALEVQTGEGANVVPFTLPAEVTRGAEVSRMMASGESADRVVALFEQITAPR